MGARDSIAVIPNVRHKERDALYGDRALYGGKSERPLPISFMIRVDLHPDVYFVFSAGE